MDFLGSTKQGFVLLSVYFCIWELHFFSGDRKIVLLIKHSTNESTKISTHHPKKTTSNIFPRYFLYISQTFTFKIDMHIDIQHVSIIINLHFKWMLALCITRYLSWPSKPTIISLQFTKSECPTGWQYRDAVPQPLAVAYRMCTMKAERPLVESGGVPAGVRCPSDCTRTP